MRPTSTRIRARFRRALPAHAVAALCAAMAVAVALLVRHATGSPVAVGAASYRPDEQGPANPEIFNRTRRNCVRVQEKRARVCTAIAIRVREWIMPEPASVLLLLWGVIASLAAGRSEANGRCLCVCLCDEMME
jgi:hypothetical protein